jgi:hypothetical protein
MTSRITTVDFDELPTGTGVWLAWRVTPEDEESDYSLLEILNVCEDFNDGVTTQNAFNTTTNAGQYVQTTSKTIFNPLFTFTTENDDDYDDLLNRVEYSNNYLIIDGTVYANMAFEGDIYKTRFGRTSKEITFKLRQVEPPYTGGGGID